MKTVQKKACVILSSGANFFSLLFSLLFVMAPKILVVTGLCLKIYNGGVGGQGGGVLGDREKARDGWREGGGGWGAAVG